MGFHISNSYLSEEGALVREGVALFEVGSAQQDVKLVRASCKKLAEAVRLQPTWAHAWHILARGSFHLSILTGSQDRMWAAKLQIDQAIALSPTPEICATAGLIYERVGALSQEACDYVAAITFFERGQLGVKEWVACGRAYAALSERLNDERLLIKAAHCLRKGRPVGNVELSRVLRKLFFTSLENSLMMEAKSSLFEAQAPENREVHLEKIELLLEMADFRGAITWCEQFPKQTDPHLLALWAEALARMGEQEDRPDLIHEAERKIDQIEDGDSSAFIHIGKALFASARYFCDLDLYYQALEAFQAATSLDRTEATAWKWMGKSAMAVSELSDDDELPLHAFKFYKKALALKPDHELYFSLATLLIQQDEIPLVEQAISYLDYLKDNYPLIYHKNADWAFHYALAHDALGFLKGDGALYKQAVAAFYNVHTLAPDYPNLHYHVALLYSHMAQDFDSISDFYRALRHFELGSKKIVKEELLYIDWGLTWLHLFDYATEAKTADDCLDIAEKKFKMAAELGSRDVYYPLACLYSLKDQCDLALHYLERGHKADTLPTFAEMEADEWLENFRFSPQFQHFLALLQQT